MRMKVAVPVENGRVSPTFARAPEFEIFEVDNAGVHSVSTVANPYANGAGGVGQSVVRWLASMGVEAVVAANVGPQAFENLHLVGIRFYQAPPGLPAGEAVKVVFSGGPRIWNGYGPRRGVGRMRKGFWGRRGGFWGRGMGRGRW